MGEAPRVPLGDTTGQTARMQRRALGSGLVLLAGAGAYALLVGVAGTSFAVTPLFLGAVAVVAGVAGTRPRVIGTGAVLAGWGAAVLLVDRGVVPGERTASPYMLGIASGLLVAAALAGPRDRSDWLTSGAVAAFTGPLALYLSYDVATFGRWPLWAFAMLAWAAWELFWGLRSSGEPSAVAP